jgi:hypothetical protein
MPSRESLFSREICVEWGRPVEIDASRLAAECILIFSLSGIAVLLLSQGSEKNG